MRIDDPRLPERFWAKVCPEPNSGCWLWTGKTNGYGYGLFRSSRSHRTVWRAAHGEAGGMFVLHRCDTPSCVNPAHLFLGTQADNMADMVRKGRSSRVVRAAGARNGKAKLTDGAVRRIRDLYATGMRQVDIAAAFGIAQTTVSGIVRGGEWIHIERTTTNGEGTAE